MMQSFILNCLCHVDASSDVWLGITVGRLKEVERLGKASSSEPRSSLRDFNQPCRACRAKLASLFGLDQDSTQGNESFQYTAPKQPRKSSTPGEAPTHTHSPQRECVCVCDQQD